MSYLDEYGDPSEDQINDWNIHNDHQISDDELNDEPVCIECGNPYVPNWDIHTCDSCMAEFWHRNPDPLDIAEREEREAEFFGLDDERDMGY